ncbi:metal ABC transporter solute-binding protein, Zn/Mn family [Marinobacterium mangrovicola]|uniref:ABC-type Zn uptake system ZnuABC Zn-binding protein ZnuA n=1 Tax=Marinobacterium mangrovicola TaxID=1476959 RepID=A0A4R1G793_9GAMM|nr:zinc ABC transporter substrate-binding protein [Marinobacterium mangrovicola]TCK03684.1 ABC-type Zn uptake system ZnuABC Zn-binding protein ZnuA [Marinobacterium mangrovicola]
MKRQSLICLLLALFSLNVSAAEQDEPLSVMVAHPALQAISERLVQQTGIQILPVQPAKLPPSRLRSYLGGRGEDRLAEVSQQADAVITLGSLWQQDPIYPFARRFNIRIAEIDATEPLDQALPGIARLRHEAPSALYATLGLEPMPANGEESAPWLSPTALGSIADILVHDLARFSPADAQQLETNLAAFKRELIKTKSEADLELALAYNLTTLSLSPHFDYLASDLGLDLLASLYAAPNEWTVERLSQLADYIRDNDVAVVLVDHPLDEQGQQRLEEAGARVIQLNQLEAVSRQEIAAPLEVIQANLAKLVEAYTADADS